MREFRHPPAVGKYWGLTFLAALAVLLWLVMYQVYVIYALTQFGSITYYRYRGGAFVEFADHMARFANRMIPFLSVSKTAAVILVGASVITTYCLVVFPLCLVWRRRITYSYRLEPNGLTRRGPRKESSIEFAEIRDVRTGLFRTLALRTRFEAMLVPLALEESRELLDSIRGGVAAAGGDFREDVYRKAVDLTAFAKWKIRYSVGLVAGGALLAGALFATSYWLTDMLWRRADPIVVGGASIFLLPIYIAGPWWLAFRRFRGAHRDDWRPPVPGFAFWTIFLSAIAAWSTYEATLLVILRP